MQLRVYDTLIVQLGCAIEISIEIEPVARVSVGHYAHDSCVYKGALPLLKMQHGYAWTLRPLPASDCTGTLGLFVDLTGDLANLTQDRYIEAGLYSLSLP